MNEMENPQSGKRDNGGEPEPGHRIGQVVQSRANGWGWIVRPKSPGAFELISSRRAPDSVVADFDRAPWQDMLKLCGQSNYVAREA